VHAAALLGGAGVDAGRVRFVEVEYDDTWLRDSGPLTLAGDGAFRLVDFRFTGWGGKFEGGRDDRLIEALIARGVFRASAHRRIDWALEGGAIESDGKGTILTTWRCLHQRHPDMSRDEMTARLTDAFDAERVLWLDFGYLEGDDTDAHIDTLARFAPDDAIVFQTCDDPADPHYAELARMHAEIASLRTTDGRPYRLHPLPWARAIVDEDRRLASSYANYLIVNDAVIMPAYGDAADIAAARVVAAAHPGREVILVDARPLIWQNGSVHCLTMQLPTGAVAAEISP
jgi:agmatine/peptidylarginine deiminase